MQQRLAEEMVTSAEQLVSLNEQRIKVGRGDEFQAALSRANVATFRDSVEQFKLAHTQALRALEALLGRYPSASVDVAPEFAKPPAAVPADCRPSCRAPAGRGRGEPARRGGVLRRLEAKAARLPTISLTAWSVISSEPSCCRSREPGMERRREAAAADLTGGALKTQASHRRAAPGDRGLRAHRRTRIWRGRERALRRVRCGTTRGNPWCGSVGEPESLTLQIRYKVGSGDLLGVQQQQLAVQGSRLQRYACRPSDSSSASTSPCTGGGFDTAAAVAESGEQF
jgi:hypothetical protein